MFIETWGPVIYSVAPTILLGLTFWFIMRAILRADRTERKVYAEIEAEERAARAKTATGSSTAQSEHPTTAQ